jgi:nucleoside 2-deoxyribosyltransferase
MRIYLASNWGSKKRISALRDQIQLLGHTICSNWLDEDSDQNFEGIDNAQRQEYACRALGEILTSDLLILDTVDASPSGGREIEMGFAVGQGVPVWVVGPERNIFHSIAARRYTTWTDVLFDLSADTGRPHARV